MLVHQRVTNDMHPYCSTQSIRSDAIVAVTIGTFIWPRSDAASRHPRDFTNAKRSGSLNQKKAGQEKRHIM